MAKGQKLTTSRSERYLESYSYGNGQGTNSGISELGEEDVWCTVDDVTNSNDDVVINNSRNEWGSRASGESNGGFSTRSRRANVGGMSLAFADTGKATASRIVHNQFRASDSVAASPRGHHMATSAPVNVPDWSKIYRVDSVESMHDTDDDERDMEMIPPHEYLAREYARGRKSGGASVFEGVGRTLKGRDLRRVRDAVWSQTGRHDPEGRIPTRQCRVDHVSVGRRRYSMKGWHW